MRGEGRANGLDIRGVKGEESCGLPVGDRVEESCGEPVEDTAEKEAEKIFTIRPL